MGYTTDFWGEFEVTPPLKPEHRDYLTAFARTRRMKRNPGITETYPDPLREAVGLPVGPDGAYYVGGGEGVDMGDKKPNSFFDSMGQTHTPDIVDYNEPPGAVVYQRTGDTAAYMASFNQRWEAQQKRIEDGLQQPGLWCQWVPGADGATIEWDGGEKFYEYIAWIKYLIRNFLAPWGYELNGEVGWQGEESGDAGKIRIEKNEVKILRAQVTYVEAN